MYFSLLYIKLKYKLTKWISLHFLFYNGVFVNYYWNVMFVNFINTQSIRFCKRDFRLKIFFFLTKNSLTFLFS